MGSERKVRDPSPTPCNSCGVEGYELAWMPHVTADLLRRGMCHRCSIWTEIVEELPRFVVINGTVWAPQKDNPELRKKTGGWGMGCGGTMHKIVKFDGEVIMCNNLWCRGDVPELFRDRIPDNARFEKNEEEERDVQVLQ